MIPSTARKLSKHRIGEILYQQLALLSISCVVVVIYLATQMGWKERVAAFTRSSQASTVLKSRKHGSSTIS